MDKETTEKYMQAISYDVLPQGAREALRWWVETGYFPTSHFLGAVLRNDLVGAYSAADEHNTRNMKDYASWLFNNAPQGCWRAENINSWSEQGGLEGILKGK